MSKLVQLTLIASAAAVSLALDSQASEHTVEPPLVTPSEVPTLVSKLKGATSQQKIDAMFKLRGTRPTSAKLPAVLPVVQLLKNDPDPNVRRYAAEELGLLPATKESVAALFEALDSPDRDTRWRAANSIPGGKEYLQQLLNGFKNKDVGVRVRLIDKFQLDPVDDPAVVPALMRMLTDGDRSVRASTALALVKYGPKGGEAEPALMARWRVEDDNLTASFLARAVAAVGHVRPVDLPFLQACIRKEREYGVRVSCVKAMGKLGALAAPATNDLIALIASTRDCMLKAACADTLSIIGPSAHQAVPVLVATLVAPRHDDYRYASAAALGVVATKSDKAAVAALQYSLNSEDAAVKNAARKALRQLGVRPSPPPVKPRI